MKKYKYLILTLIFSMVVLAGCQAKKNAEDNNITPEPTKAEEITVTPTEEPTKEEENTAEKITMNIAALKGPTAMGMVELMERAENGETANNYDFTIAGTADEITTNLIKGDFQIAAIPCNLASILYQNSEGKIQVAGINTLGVLYIVETGDSIKSVEDLKGKTIYSTGKGTTPEFTLNYLLSSHGIDPSKDVTIEYKSEATEVAAILSETDNAIAMLPQPYVTTVQMTNDKVRVALDVTKEWEALNSDSSVVTGVVVVNKKFADENKEAVEAFLSEYKDSVTYVNSNVEEASALVEKFGIVKAPVAKQALPYCNITLIRGEEMKSKVNGYLKVLYDQKPESVGGKLPEEGFFWE
ncbi:ABC transporter substrate-binding protein [Lachnoclostridium sp.]|uniref:ABC transporter substrate-binding protein n=1 Tax=Lachnoclostridium sp. TaxID=2028282 RepID=UPI00289AD316|nr:ABC transporter substrate-binding protein [Lachnoclostridium sp.]